MGIDLGTRLGAYELLGPLGSGGMGEVYKARDSRLDRIVAIKVLSDSALGQADARARFQREALAIAALNHPHICTLYDVGHEHGVDFIIMEYVEGESLSSRLTRGPMSVMLLDWRAASRTAREVSRCAVARSRSAFEATPTRCK